MQQLTRSKTLIALTYGINVIKGRKTKLQILDGKIHFYEGISGQCVKLLPIYKDKSSQILHTRPFCRLRLDVSERLREGLYLYQAHKKMYCT